MSETRSRRARPTLSLAPVLAFVLALVAAAPSARAQDPEQDPFERVEMMRMWGLTRQLDLSEDETAKLFPVLNRNADQRRRIYLELRSLREDVRGLVDADSVDDAALKRTIHRMFDLESELITIRTSEYDEVEKLLGGRRAVRFVVFDHRFRNRVRDLVDQEQSWGGPMARRRFGGEGPGANDGAGPGAGPGPGRMRPGGANGPGRMGPGGSNGAP